MRAAAAHDIELGQQINSGKEISPITTTTRIGACVVHCSWEARKKKMMMRRFLLCALLLVLLCMVACIAEGRGGSRGGGRRAYIGGGGGARGSASGSPRSLSGGTWAACIGSSLLVAAAML
jgi:hypothetical protein